MHKTLINHTRPTPRKTQHLSSVMHLSAILCIVGMSLIGCSHHNHQKVDHAYHYKNQSQPVSPALESPPPPTETETETSTTSSTAAAKTTQSKSIDPNLENSFATNMSAEKTPSAPEKMHSNSRAPSTNTPLQGIDVSHFQGDVDWRQVKQAGIQFAFIKASQGQHTVDSKFKTNHEQLESQKILWGVYHYLDPSIDPYAQADHFIQTGSLSI